MKQNNSRVAFAVLKHIYALILLLPAMSFAQSEPVGFATLNGSTTGGLGGDTVYVTSRNELLNALDTQVPLTILIKDTIDLKFGELIPVKSSNISLAGKNRNAMLRYGGLKLKGNNIIVQNLSIGESYTPGHWDGKGEPRTDAITVYGKNIWIDHCNLFYSHDGLLDFSDNNNECADFVTVSWTRFSNHNKVMLVGSNDECIMCREQFHITVHHCWFDGTSKFYDPVDKKYHRAQQRMPRVRFGEVHVFNCYYEDVADYCIAARLESEVFVENNFFRNLEDAHIIKDQGRGIKDPELVAVNNSYENVEGDCDTAGSAFLPSEYYPYIPDDPKTIPALVMNEAGTFNRRHNNPPVARNDTITIVYSTKVSVIYPLENDLDPDGDSIRISSIINSPDGKWTILPSSVEYWQDFSKKPESDLIEYEIIDFEGGMSTGTIFIRFMD